MITISCQFDSGAIAVLRADDPNDIQLQIPKDNAADIAQWFHFCLQGAAGVPVTLRFTNAGQTAYPKGWDGYRVVASHDRQHWHRIETSYDGAVMTAQLTPHSNSVYLAYFEPYSWERHLDLLASAATCDHVQLERLGASLDGRDMDVLHITDRSSTVPLGEKRQIWLIARQHPGETMAEWFAEGFLERLLDGDDPVARVLLQRCVFHVVPNMNPDGSVRGNLRTNAAGANLNREWLEPTMERSPEVFLVRRAMERSGVDLFLDAHGDEALAYNFVAGSEGVVGFSDRLQQLQDAFKSSWIASCPDFQDRVNYGPARATQANPTVATNWVAQRFDCLSFTIEMPFKDNSDLPDAAPGWSGERSRKLGAGVLQPVLAVLAQLR
ncbi:MAG: M14-type cytosolic carboxypeptidase [Burkholderiaceae bacterium]